jgi:hypothetical protein
MTTRGRVVDLARALRAAKLGRRRVVWTEAQKEADRREEFAALSALTVNRKTL